MKSRTVPPGLWCSGGSRDTRGAVDDMCPMLPERWRARMRLEGTTQRRETWAVILLHSLHYFLCLCAFPSFTHPNPSHPYRVWCASSLKPFLLEAPFMLIIRLLPNYITQSSLSFSIHSCTLKKMESAFMHRLAIFSVFLCKAS